MVEHADPGDELVARAVESVFAESGAASHLKRQRVGACRRRNRRVEGRVEHHGLRQLGVKLATGRQQSQRGWIVDGCQILHFFQSFERFVVDDDVILEYGSAVHHAMADGLRHEARIALQESHHCREGRAVVGHVLLVVFQPIECAMVNAAGERGLRAHAFGLARGQLGLARHVDQPVLQRRAAAVENNDAHGDLTDYRESIRKPARRPSCAQSRRCRSSR